MAMGWDDALMLGGLSLASSAAGAGISSAVGSATSSRVARKTAKYNLKNAMAQMAAQDKYQRAYAKDMSAWASAYGPSMKMAGLEAAGLNPILAYDSVSGALPSASYSGGSGVSSPYSPPSIDILGGISSALNLKQQYARANRADDIVDAEIGQSVSSASLNEQNAEKASADTVVAGAQADKLRAETAGIKLNNDLKAATNGRDIARAKSDYENDMGFLKKNEKLGGTPFVENRGQIGFRPFTEYEKKIMNVIENEKYLNSMERSIILDSLRGVKDGASAFKIFKGKK